MVKIESLSNSFGESLTENTADCVSELAEIALDSQFDEGILKEIPFISVAFSLYRIGNSIYEINNLKKLATFLDEINNCITSEEKRSCYISKFSTNEKFRNKELEYLLILIERYIGYERPKMLARIYVAYLDGLINWLTFLQYSEVIDRLLPGDFDLLKSASSYETIQDLKTDSILRLIGMGLVIEDIRKADVEYIAETETISINNSKGLNMKKRKYSRTEFGDLLVQIICE